MTVSRLQHATGQDNSPPALSVAFPHAVTADSVLVARISINCSHTNTGTVTAVSDDVNGAWTRASVDVRRPGGLECDCEDSWWYLGAGALPGATTVTATITDLPSIAMAIIEYQGLVLPPTVVGHSETHDTGPDHLSLSTVTTDWALLLCGFGDCGDYQPYTPVGWVAAATNAPAGEAQVFVEEKLTEPAGTYQGHATALEPSSFAAGVGVLFLALRAPEPVIVPASPGHAAPSTGIGRGEHRVFLYERGGESFVGEVGFTSLTYSRRLDDKSTARVSIGAGTKTFLGDLRGWKHELLIARDDEEVWLGPIHEPEWESSVVTLPADDLLGWLDNRDIAADLTMKNVDLATVFARLVHDSMEREPSPGLYAAASLSGVIGDRSYVAAQHRAVGDALRSLGQAGVDYTCILRRLYIGALQLLPSITLTDDTLRPPKVTEGKAATKVTLVGATTASIGNPIEAQAGGPNVELGLLEKTINDPDVMTHDGAVHYARDAYAFLNPAPLYVSGVLAPSAPVDMEHLIPGMHVAAKLSSTDRKVDAVCRLTQVDVTVRPSEQGQTETVAVTLVPIGLEG